MAALPTRELLEASVGDRQTAATIAAHFLEFVVLAVLVRLAASHLRPAPATRLTLLVGVAVALGTELLQGALPYRTFEVRDLAVNLLGLVVGLVLVSRLGKAWSGAAARRA